MTRIVINLGLIMILTHYLNFPSNTLVERALEYLYLQRPSKLKQNKITTNNSRYLVRKRQ